MYILPREGKILILKENVEGVNSEASTGVYTFLKLELFKKMKEMNKMKMGKG